MIGQMIGPSDWAAICEILRAAMRVLYVTTEFPWPSLHGGRVRSLSQLRLLSGLPEVSTLRLFSLREVAVSQADQRALRQHCGQPDKLELVEPVWHPIHLRQHRRAFAEVAVRRVTQGLPYLLGKWLSRDVDAALRRELCPTGQPPWDVVYIDHLAMAVYLPLIRQVCPRARVVLECHNVESEFFAQFAAQRSWPLRLVAEREAALAAQHEARLVAQVDAVVAISQRDADALRALVWDRRQQAVWPLVVPPTVELQPVELLDTLPPRVVYVGNLTWHPNVAGLDWLCQKVWPLVRAQRPEATLTIAGSGLSQQADGSLAVPSGWRGDGIDVVGFVPALRDFVQGAAAMAAPVFGGSGVRIKLLDSLRLGVPTVTTHDGASGLPLHDDQELLISDDADGFAARLVRLCDDGALRRRLVQAGLTFLRTHHSQARAERGLRLALGLTNRA